MSPLLTALLCLASFWLGMGVAIFVVALLRGDR